MDEPQTIISDGRDNCMNNAEAETEDAQMSANPESSQSHLTEEQREVCDATSQIEPSPMAVDEGQTTDESKGQDCGASQSQANLDQGGFVSIDDDGTHVDNAQLRYCSNFHSTEDSVLSSSLHTSQNMAHDHESLGNTKDEEGLAVPESCMLPNSNVLVMLSSNSVQDVATVGDHCFNQTENTNQDNLGCRDDVPIKSNINPSPDKGSISAQHQVSDQDADRDTSQKVHEQTHFPVADTGDVFHTNKTEQCTATQEVPGGSQEADGHIAAGTESVLPFGSYSQTPHDDVNETPTESQPPSDVEMADEPCGPLDWGYRFSAEHIPQLVFETRSEFEQPSNDNFLRGCKWSSDGSTLAVNSNDNCLRVYNTTAVTEDSNQNDVKADVVIKEGSQIYDFCWFPCTVPPSQATSRVASTCSGIPIHLWDSTSGQRLASYRAFDQNDEITAAVSISFSPDGSKLYAGFKKTIRIFNTSRPGRECKTMPTYNSKSGYGMTGIVSCFAHCPSNSAFYAAGTYNRYVGVFDSNTDRLVSLVEGPRGGITHIMFSPDGSKLYSGGRKDPEIVCWDMRNPGVPLFSMLRDVKTNQRMQFDLTRCGRYLCSGHHDGSVSVWDTLGPTQEVAGDLFLQPQCQFQAHMDCVNSISFNPQHHFLATGSGQRHFQNSWDSDSDSSDDSTDDKTAQQGRDFSLKMWTVAHGAVQNF